MYIYYGQYIVGLYIRERRAVNVKSINTVFITPRALRS